MSEHLIQKTLSYPSADGSSTVVASIWQPSSTVCTRGIVQINHGMSEHILRYDDFARTLCSAGYIVVGNDHIGHGRSSTPDTRGVLDPLHGADALIEDAHTLHQHMRQHYDPSLPYYFFGHSMGSFIARAYAGRYGASLSGVIVCGTGSVSPLLSRIGFLLSYHLCKTKGIAYASSFIDGLGVGAYSKAVPGPTGYEWLSYNNDNVRAYNANPLCGFMFSVGGYAALSKLTQEACSPAAASHIPPSLPFLFIAGEDDPVGASGKGVRKAAQLTKDAGVADVTTVLYPRMRHEILCEDNHSLVYSDILKWLGEHHGNN